MRTFLFCLALFSLALIPAVAEAGCRAGASSNLPASKVSNYKASNICDQDPATAWVENAGDHGVGEWVLLETDPTRIVTGVRIINGYAKAKAFAPNSRVSQALLELSDGTRVNVTLGDDQAPQTFSLGPTRTYFIKLTILGVYPGNKYQDTCISEIEAVYGQ